MTEIRIKGVTKRYGDVTAVDRVDLTIEKGELFFLLGPSGCGKTTLLRTVAGFAECDEGEIWFGDRNMTDVPPYKRNCGFVFQNYALWPHMTVFENVAYGLKLRHYSKDEINARVNEALSLVRLEGLGDRRPTRLSGGQQQRVALARALVIQPDVLLLDEPLSNLDAKLRLEMRDEIRRIHRRTGITTIYVTHEQKEALSLAHRIAVMRDGKVIQIGRPRELYNSPKNMFVAGFIGETNFIRGSVISPDTVKVSFGEIKLADKTDLSGDVTVSIRPEAIKPAGDGTFDSNVFSAVVERSTYLGEVQQLVVSFGEESGIKVFFADPSGLTSEEGDRLKLYINPDGVRVFRE